jgi:hypothetical protein
MKPVESFGATKLVFGIVEFVEFSSTFVIVSDTKFIPKFIN